MLQIQMPVAPVLHFFFEFHFFVFANLHFKYMTPPPSTHFFWSSRNFCTPSTSSPPSTTQKLITSFQTVSLPIVWKLSPSPLCPRTEWIRRRAKAAFPSIRSTWILKEHSCGWRLLFGLLDGLVYSKEGRHRRVVGFMAPTLDQTSTLVDMSRFCFLRPRSLLLRLGTPRSLHELSRFDIDIRRPSDVFPLATKRCRRRVACAVPSPSIVCSCRATSFA